MTPMNSGALVNPIVTGVPFGRRSPRKQGPYSTPIHGGDRALGRRANRGAGPEPGEAALDEVAAIKEAAQPRDGG